VFAWEPSNVRPEAKLVKKKLWKQSMERQNFIREEDKKLLNAGFIHKV
jgi:hypothetical protein